MIYYFERTKIAGDESYVTISMREDGTQERSFMFEESSEFSEDEKYKLSAVVPINGFVASTLDYKVCNFTYDPIAIRVLVRRDENDCTLLFEI